MLTELVDYEYYTKEYGGSSIPESSFKKIVIEASSKINYYTFRRVTKENLDNNIKNTACQIAEVLFEQAELRENILNNSKATKEIASESLGPHSISYVNKSNLQANQILSKRELEKLIYKICYQSLVHTGLMFRGVC